MDEHTRDHTDKWSGVLNDSESLSRFMSFVNAPETPNPTIRFTEQRGQIRPAPVELPVPTVRTDQEVSARNRAHESPARPSFGAKRTRQL